VPTCCTWLMKSGYCCGQSARPIRTTTRTIFLHKKAGREVWFEMMWCMRKWRSSTFSSTPTDNHSLVTKFWYAHTHIHKNIRILHTHTYIHCMHTHTYTTCTYTYIHYMHTHTYTTCIHIHTLHAHTYIHTLHTHTYIHMLNAHIHTYIRTLHAQTLVQGHTPTSKMLREYMSTCWLLLWRRKYTQYCHTPCCCENSSRSLSGQSQSHCVTMATTKNKVESDQKESLWAALRACGNAPKRYKKEGKSHRKERSSKRLHAYEHSDNSHARYFLFICIRTARYPILLSPCCHPFDLCSHMNFSWTTSARPCVRTNWACLFVYFKLCTPVMGMYKNPAHTTSVSLSPCSLPPITATL